LYFQNVNKYIHFKKEIFTSGESKVAIFEAPVTVILLDILPRPC